MNTAIIPAASGAPSSARFDPDARSVPRLGGFNLVTLGLELRRLLRNRRVLVFNLILPAALFLSFGSSSGTDDPAGHGNVAAYILISFAVYGACQSAASTGASVSIERAQGWSRQLRLTPLHPVAAICIKALVAVVLSAVAMGVVYLIGLLQHQASMPVHLWIASAALTVVCSMVFSALGLFVGYLVPGENAMQILGPGMTVLAFLGDVFIPLTSGSTIYRIAQFTPMFGVVHLVRAPLLGDFQWTALLNLVVWLAIFVGLAAWRMSRDTARG